MNDRMFGMLRVLLVALVALSFSLTGCDKKGDVDENAPAAQGEGGDKGATPGEADKAGAAKKDPAAKAGDKAATPAGKTPAAAAPSIDLPKEVLSYGSLKSLDDMVGSINSIVSMFTPMPGLGSTLEEQLKTALALKDLTWLERTKPIKYLVWKHANMDAPYVLLIPMKDKAAFEAAMPATKKQNDAGNAWSLKGLTDVMYINYVDGFVALTGDAEIFAVTKGFIEKTIVGLAADNLMDIHIPVHNIVGMFGGQVDTFLKEFEKHIEMAAKTDPELAPLTSYMSTGFVTALEIVKELEVVTISFAVDGGQLTIPMTFNYKPGGKLAAMGKGMTTRSMNALALMPKDSYLVFGTNIDPTVFEGYLGMATQMYAELFKWTPEVKAEFDGLLKELSSQTGGDQAMAFYAEGSYPVNIISVADHKDKAKVMAGLDKLWDFMFKHIVANTLELAKAEGGAPPDLKLESMDDVIKLINQFGGQMGISATKSEQTYKDTTFSKLAITVDWAKIPPSGDQEAIEMAKLFLGNKIELVMGFGDKYGYFAMGPDVMPRLEKIVDGEKELAQNTVYQGTFGADAKNLQGVFFASPMMALKAMSSMPFLAPYKAQVDAAQPKKGIAFGFKMDTSKFAVSLDLPLDEFSAMAKIFQ